MRHSWLLGILLMLAACAPLEEARQEVIVDTGVIEEPVPAPPNGTIVAFGDSITAGFGVAPQEAYPYRLQLLLQEHGYNYTVINMGRSGDTSESALARVDEVTALDPDIVILQIGANDAKALVDPAITKENIEAIVTELVAHNITVVLAGSPVVRIAQWDFPQRFTEIYPAIAQERNLTYIPFFLRGVIGVGSMNLQDGVHPAAAGHAAIAENTLPYAIEAIERR